MLNEALLLEFSERGERIFERLVFRSDESAEPEIHDLERIETQVAQIVVYGVHDLPARACVRPGTVRAAAGADFGHDDQIIRFEGCRARASANAAFGRCGSLAALCRGIRSSRTTGKAA